MNDNINVKLFIKIHSISIIIILGILFYGFITLRGMYKYGIIGREKYKDEELYKKLETEKEENFLKLKSASNEVELKKQEHEKIIEEKLRRTSYNIRIPLHEPKINCWFKDRCIVCEEDIWEHKFPNIDGDKSLLQVKRINGDNVIFVNQTKNKEIEFYLNGQCERSTLKEYNHTYMYDRSLIGIILNNKILNINPFKKAELECPTLLEELLPDTDITQVQKRKREDICNILKNSTDFEFK
jgi:hypothetical protein